MVRLLALAARTHSVAGVDRSREKAKREEYETEVQLRVTAHENELLERRIVELRNSIDLWVVRLPHRISCNFTLRNALTRAQFTTS